MSDPELRQRLLTDVEVHKLQDAERYVRAAANMAFAKHGVDQTPMGAQMPVGEKLAILGEEFGEVCRALTYDAAGGTQTERTLNLATELEQLAAMALLWRASL